jgi:hypothetical protein
MTDLLFDLPGVPNKAELELADRIRELHLKHNPTTLLPIKTDRGWRRHRPVWAGKLATVRDEVSHEQVLAAAQKIYTDTRRWKDTSWPEVVSKSSDPVGLILRCLPSLVGGRPAKHNLEIDQRTWGCYYFCDGKEIDADTYMRLRKENKANGY